MARRKSDPSEAGPSVSREISRLIHDGDTRMNIPTAEYQPLVEPEVQAPVRVVYARRNRDLDPQLVWRGKDAQDTTDLAVDAPPLYIQERIDPKVLVDDLMRVTTGEAVATTPQLDLFGDFKELPENVRTEFYKHDQGWANRMILGDSLQVMASLAERERLRGQVQCIYFDPPYGIKFNSNFQWSTTSRDVKDGDRTHITREPEQVRAFRDTWRDGIHSYLSYLRDRLVISRDLLTETGSIFVQIGDENVHRVRALLDELFGDDNFIVEIRLQKTGSLSGNFIQSNADSILWYAKNRAVAKFRPLYVDRELGGTGGSGYTSVTLADGSETRLTDDTKRLPDYRDENVWRSYPLTSQGSNATTTRDFNFQGKRFHPGKDRHWGVAVEGLTRVGMAGRLVIGQDQVSLKRYLGDSTAVSLGALWTDAGGVPDKIYVVQTSTRAVQRCILMATDPGDLVLDPTCGSGTTAFVAEQWGRRWITLDTSRVALTLARARLMGATFPYYLLSDSPEGHKKEAALAGRAESDQPTHKSVRLGFVCARAPRITVSAIANNSDIVEIYERHEKNIAGILESINGSLKGHARPFLVRAGGRSGSSVRFDAPDEETVALPELGNVRVNALLEWEVPRSIPSEWPHTIAPLIASYWDARLQRQREMDASIRARADYDLLHDQPFEVENIVRVPGPFTVESVSPYRSIGVGLDGEPIDKVAETRAGYGGQTFVDRTLELLRVAGVQQADRAGRIAFATMTPFPGEYIQATATYMEAGKTVKAAIAIGPEFATVRRQDLLEAAREASDAQFDILVSCAFSYDAHATEFNKLGKVTVLKARMNGELHMAGELKPTKGNLFVIFGEPDVDIVPGNGDQFQVRINGIDVYDPTQGEIRSGGPDDIACWFIDTNYSDESFCVRHAYFLGANDPYGALKRTLKTEIDEAAWQSLHSAISRPFPKPRTGKIAIKVINHLGDEVMKVFRIGGA